MHAFEIPRIFRCFSKSVISFFFSKRQASSRNYLLYTFDVPRCPVVVEDSDVAYLLHHRHLATGVNRSLLTASREFFFVETGWGAGAKIYL